MNMIYLLNKNTCIYFNASNYSLHTCLYLLLNKRPLFFISRFYLEEKNILQPAISKSTFK